MLLTWKIQWVWHRASITSMSPCICTSTRPALLGLMPIAIIHGPRNELLIGPHVIDVDGNVRTIDALVGHRLADTMQHLTDPENKVYYLAMEGEFFEVDLRTLEVTVNCMT